MKLIINFYNQTGAGPKNISLNFIQTLKKRKSNTLVYVIVPNVEEFFYLKSDGNVQLIKFKKFNNLFCKISFRLFLDFIFIPFFMKRNKIENLLAFGNYLVTPIKANKVVLLHHPYLVDNNLLKELHFFPRMAERLKRLAFAATVKNVNKIVVQSEYMKASLGNVWSDNVESVIIPNPISENFTGNYTVNDIHKLINNRLDSLKKVSIFYVSRFYPHKNHSFLIRLSEHLNSMNIAHEFIITVDYKKPETVSFVNSISKKSSIRSLGEVSQSELEKYYKSANLFIFPSDSETFGNPLIEAMKYGLPIIVPNLNYAISVVGDSGIYYGHNDVRECADLIKNLISNRVLYISKSIASAESFSKYPNADEWVNMYLELMKSN